MSKPVEYRITVRQAMSPDSRLMERVVYCVCEHQDDKLSKDFMADIENLAKKHFPSAEIKITRTGEMTLETLQTKTLTEAISSTFGSIL